MKTIRVRYFETLKDQRGLYEEALQTEAMTPEELYRDLTNVHKFSLSATVLRSAVNDDFVPMNTPLWEGDTVTFVPAG
jgi:molybdopterin converting factor small subunit